ncbi:MAG: S9 family peptidase, partial [Proteobacteria bacterium]|nr:S9 family peptidase [Pseudomonadota bacterium]
MRGFFLFLCAGALLAGAASAAELPVSDFAKHPTLTSPSLSPDGKYLAVAVSENTDSTDADYQLAVLQLPDLKPVSRLNMAPRNVPIDIHWVSDTRLIMAVGRETGTLESPSATGDIIAVDYDGSHKKTLYSLQHRGDAYSNVNSLDIPRGSPSIAELPPKPDGHFTLNLQVFPENSNGTDWDSSKSQLYDVDATSGNATKIGEIQHGSMNLLSNNGVARIASGMDDDNETQAFSSTDGNHWTKLPASVTGKYFQPLAISADGRHLYARASMDGGPNQLIECDLDGGNRKVLASDSFASVENALFEPLTNVPYAALFTAQGKPAIQYIGDGTYAQTLQALAKTDPADFITIADASTDGGMLLVHVHGDRNPGVYALFDRSNMRAAPLYQVLPWIDPKQMPQRTPVQFKARDGVPLVGYLTMPAGSDGKNLPLVLIPHGGPIGVSDGWFYDPWAAFLANRGYATLQVNYRGSGGRGRNFQRSGYRQFGSGIQDDLIDGVKWAIAQGHVDPKRICVFGGSFGGYSSLMQPILAPDLYKCAIDYAGVSDMQIEFNDSDTRRFANGRTYLQQAVGTLADARAISPITMLDKFHVPVLLVHGKDAPRVPYSNATDLRSALDKAGKPYEWLVKPGELHGFYAEKNNEELFTTMQAFLGKYIGAGDAPPAAAKG